MSKTIDLHRTVKRMNCYEDTYDFLLECCQSYFSQNSEKLAGSKAPDLKLSPVNGIRRQPGGRRGGGGVHIDGNVLNSRFTRYTTELINKVCVDLSFCLSITVEYDGYDDVYGHSVEEADFCISPGTGNYRKLHSTFLHRKTTDNNLRILGMISWRILMSKKLLFTMLLQNHSSCLIEVASRTCRLTSANKALLRRKKKKNPLVKLCKTRAVLPDRNLTLYKKVH